VRANSDELIDEHADDADQDGVVDALLQPTVGRRRGQGNLGLGDASGGQQQRWVASQDEEANDRREAQMRGDEQDGPGHEEGQHQVPGVSIHWLL
jgi:hypothetical protein